jgi:hypothetical protein
LLNSLLNKVRELRNIRNQARHFSDLLNKIWRI